MITPSVPFQLTEFPQDRFQVLELLGQGGMGQVFRARDRHLNRLVALKFLLAQETPSLLVRLVLEAQYQAGLDHPHIAQVYGVGRWDGRTCVVMQLIEGSGLDQIAPSLDLSTRVELLVQAARGMHAAHLHGLVHRDLKPQNILVESQGEKGLHAYVVDFGLARATEAESLTISGAILGSPHYMSPEQATGGRLVDARSDIYSLGATLYAILVGAPPFSASTLDPREQNTRLSGTPKETDEAEPDHSSASPMPREGMHALSVLRRVLDEPPAPPRAFNAAIPLDLETIILHCLEKDPADRYPSAAALADDLERFLNGHPISVRRAPWPRRVRNWGRRHPKSTVALSVVLGVGLLALGASGLAVRRARQQARVAARFEQAAQEMEIRFRMGALSPRQNWAEEVKRLRAIMEARKQEAASIGPAAEAPGAYFQGRALLILGRYREAMQELLRAWSLGFHSQEAACALGSALLEVYSEETQRLTGSGPERQAAQRSLDQQYLQPAVRFMRLGATSGEHNNLHMAQVAYAEGREDAALQLAEAQLKETPWTIEAHRLRVFVWWVRTERAMDPQVFEGCAKETERCLASLTDVARGDPQTYLLAARWAMTKAARLTWRFRIFQPELIDQALQLALEASRLDPTSSEPLALRGEALGFKVSILNQAGHLMSELHEIQSLAMQECERALELDPDSQTAHLALAYQKLVRSEYEVEPQPQAQALEDAIRHADHMLRLNPRFTEAIRLKSQVHLTRSRVSAAKGEDGRPHLKAYLASCREIYRLWPDSNDYALDLVHALQRMAFSDAHAGEARSAQAQIQEARQILEQQLDLKPLPTSLVLQRIRQVRLDGALAGMLGQSPDPDYARALETLDSLPPELKSHPDFIDERYTVIYEQALVAMDRGTDIGPRITELQGILDAWLRAGHPRIWHALNEVALFRLRALQDLRRGRIASPAIAGGLARVRSINQKSLASEVEIWPALEGALLVQAAQGLAGNRRNTMLLEGRRKLELAAGMDASFRWTFRQEFKMAVSE